VDPTGDRELPPPDGALTDLAGGGGQAPALPDGAEVGRVLGTLDAQPLDFWVAVDERRYLELDDVIAVSTDFVEALPGGHHEVMHYGVVDIVKSAYEGATFHSDVFRVEGGLMPVGLSTVAHVAVTRVEPEIFVPPRPGRTVCRAAGDAREVGLYFDRMDRKFLAGISRDGQPMYGNLEFLDGTRGAHVNISGISGVATKTSYALFLLYGLFHGTALRHAHATHAIVFNVKGQDLLWLDKANVRLTDAHRARYESLGLPVGPFQSVGFWAPPQKGDLAVPDTGARTDGVQPYYWTLLEFCRDRLLGFLFAEADEDTSQLSWVISRWEQHLQEQAGKQPRDRADFTLDLDGVPCRVDSLLELAEAIADYINDDKRSDAISGRAAPQTRQAFARRFLAAAEAVDPLVRARREEEARGHRFDWTKKQVSVIDINRLRDRAKRFVVGVVVKRLMEEKERQGAREPLVFLVLDELNKYAPREGHSPIKEVILDISERGRSLGVVLIGAQQTASEIERRVTANASFRVVGRLDAAEGQRDEYGFLTSAARVRAAILKPGSMFVYQPDVPVPLLVQFPFPAWATRFDEVGQGAEEEPLVFQRSRPPAF
jgi:DNA helicase HerA-like ATPase